MNWINARALVIGLTASGLVTGCATQDTILPPSETPMIDIYRKAMNEVSVSGAPTVNPEAICASLQLEESEADCRKKLTAYVEAVYRQIDAEESPSNLDYLEYTRTTRSELDNLFPRLDNPDMVIYVYPHLATRTRAPIPGYTTVIPLYERVEYRLPGELIRPTPLKPLKAPKGDTP